MGKRAVHILHMHKVKGSLDLDDLGDLDMGAYGGGGVTAKRTYTK
jgi:hypothetical protein